jgi:hypothetical protein
MTFWLAFLLSGLSLPNTTICLLFSLGLGLLAAFALPGLIHRLLWRRFRSPWCDTFVFMLLAIAILLTDYAHDVRDGHSDALRRLAIHSASVALVFMISYSSQRRKNDTAEHTPAPEKT